MTQSKSLAALFSCFMLVSCLLIYSSCEDDKCTGVVCVFGFCDEDTGNCICDNGYSGTDCSVDICGENGVWNATTQVCDCAAGYEGSDCTTLSNSKYVGTYVATEADCGADPYTITVVQGDSPAEVRFENFGNYGCIDSAGDPINYFVIGTLNGDSFSISTQESCGTTFSGTDGTFEETGVDGATLRITYSAVYPDENNNTVTDVCTVEMVR